MRAENDTQWAVIPQFSDVARACSAAQSVESLTEQTFTPLAAWVGIDLISLTLIGPQRVVTVSNGAAPELLIQRIKTHAARCIGINATHPGQCEQIIVTDIDTGIERDDDGIEDDAQILWTAALQHEGRLIAVLTLYRNGTAPLSPLEIAALKQIRGLVSAAIIRIESEVVVDASIGFEIEDVVGAAESIHILNIEDAHLIEENLGSEHLARIQGEILNLIEARIEDTATIGRIGHNRIIIIRNIEGINDDAIDITDCIKACQSITVAPGIRLDLTVEEGEILHHGNRSPEGYETERPQAFPAVDTLAS